jgi:hypothetical protein
LSRRGFRVEIDKDVVNEKIDGVVEKVEHALDVYDDVRDARRARRMNMNQGLNVESDQTQKPPVATH